MALSGRDAYRSGFTLIELMIVIAIIGILAAIAIPNFIAYRNKTYCNAAESDANQVVTHIAEYFSIPEHNSLPLVSGSDSYLGYRLNDKGGQNTVEVTGSANTSIEVAVTDGTRRCPQKYRDASSDWNGYTFRKVIRPPDY